MPTLLAPPTKHGLLPEARHLVLPDGIVASGFPAVEATCRAIGIEFDPWQRDLNKCLLAKNAEGLYAADIAALSIPRQVGKTFDVGAVVFALCIQQPRLTVIWTAHRFKVSRESFNELRALAKSPKLTPHIDYDAITTAAGNECIPFRNGSRIVFAARERGAIRGFSKVGILVLDEAQILTQSTVSDLVPTMNQAANPLIVMMGTPPKPTDPGEVFTELRKDALSGASDDVLYVELSAPAGSEPDDERAMGIANPSFPGRTPRRAFTRMLRMLGLEDYLREAFGIWDENASKTAIPSHFWLARTDLEAAIGGEPVFTLDVSPKMTHSAIGVAGDAAIGLHTHLLLREGQDQVDSHPGTDWVLPALLDLKTRVPNLKVAYAANGQAKSLAPDLEAAGIETDPIPAGDVAAACGLFYKLATGGGLSHSGQPELTNSVAAAQWRDTGEGAQVWGRRKSGEITGLYAATLAVWKANQGVDPLDNIY